MVSATTQIIWPILEKGLIRKFFFSLFPPKIHCAVIWVTISNFDQTWCALRLMLKTDSPLILAFYDLRLQSYGLPKIAIWGHFRLGLQTLKSCSSFVFQVIEKFQNVLNSWKPGKKLWLKIFFGGGCDWLIDLELNISKTYPLISKNF